MSTENDLAIALADLAQRDRWLREIAIALNSNPDATGREMIDPNGLVQRIFTEIDRLQHPDRDVLARRSWTVVRDEAGMPVRMER